MGRTLVECSTYKSHPVLVILKVIKFKHLFSSLNDDLETYVTTHTHEH